MRKRVLLSVMSMTCGLMVSAQTVQNIMGSTTRGRALLQSSTLLPLPAKVSAEDLLGCPDGTVFGGEYQESDDLMTGMASSDEGRKDAATSVYQHFSGCFYKFNAIRFLGLFSYYDTETGWHYCSDRGGVDENGQMTKPVRFKVAFYEDGEDGNPGKEVFSKIVDVVGEKTGVKRGSETTGYSELYSFHVDLGEDIKMEHGFMQISAVDTKDETIDCYFALFTASSSPEYSLMKVDKRDGSDPMWNQTLSCCYCFYGSGELIAQKALMLNRFLSPSVSNAGKYSKVQVEVQNVGQQDLSDVELQLWLDGKLLSKEKLDAKMTSMESYKYTFEARVDCSAPGKHTIMVKNVTPDCEDFVCESLSTEITVGDGTVTYPESKSGNNYYYIKNVKVGDIDNPSEATPYSDFTNLKTAIQPGKTLDLEITANKKRANFGAWIDWNNNGSFDDAGETLTVGSDGKAQITIPTGNNIKTGDKRLRIVTALDTPQPTGVYNFGETEDYTLTVEKSADSPAIELQNNMVEATTNGDKKTVPFSIANNGGNTLTADVRYEYILPNAPTSEYTIEKKDVPAKIKNMVICKKAQGVSEPESSAATEYVLKYDKGQNSLTGISNSTTATYANYLPGNMLASLSGMEISSVDVYVGTPAKSNSIVIYGQKTQSENGETVVEQSFTPKENSWNHVVLDKPVKIEDTDLWIGYKTSGLTGNQFSIGIDAGNAVVGFGDMVNIGEDEWWSMSDLGMDFNYCIRANVSGKRTPAINWLSIDKNHFEISAGGSETLNVGVDATGLGKALYEAKMEISSNDDLSSVIDVPVYIVNDATTGIYAKAYTGDATIKLSSKSVSVSAEKEISSISVSDLAGRTISSTTVNGNEGRASLNPTTGAINIITVRYADGTHTAVKVPTIN